MACVISGSMLYSKRHLSKGTAENMLMLQGCGCVFDSTAYDELSQAIDASPETLTVLIFPEHCEPTSFAALSDEFMDSLACNKNAQIRHLNLFVKALN
jgi:hypothetical protein